MISKKILFGGFIRFCPDINSSQSIEAHHGVGFDLEKLFKDVDRLFVFLDVLVEGTEKEVTLQMSGVDLQYFLVRDDC